jgi:Rho GTPase-activating protein 1
MLFSLAGAIISPKFFRKIQYIPTLSALAQHVPIAQIDIAPAVYQENLKYESQITVPPAQQSSVFGVSLDQLMGGYGESSGIPRVVKDCVEYIREKGMETEGLFRRSPSSALLSQVKDAYNRGQSVSLASFNDVHMAAVLLKKFFRDLPEPIFPERLYPIIRKCPPLSSDPQDMDAVMYIRDTLIPELEVESPAGLILLTYVLHLLHEVSLRSNKNRMDAANLAIVFCPNLVSSGDVMRDVQICKVPGVSSKLPQPLPSSPTSPSSPNSTRSPRTTLGSVIRLCIERYFEIFEDLRDRSEAVPSRIITAEKPSEVVPSDDVSTQQTVSEDDLDDTMLVMPIGPSPTSDLPNSKTPTSALPPSGPSVWTPTRSRPRGNSRTGNGPPPSAMKAVPAPSTRGSTATSVSKGKGGRSLLSIEKGIGNGKVTIGKSVAGRRRVSGAGVEAVDVTAQGFFAPPSSTPSEK